MMTKKKRSRRWLVILFLSALWQGSLHAEYLFQQFIDPGYTGSNSEYSQWDVFGPVGSQFYNIAALPDAAWPATTPPTITQTISGAFIGSTDGNWGDNYGPNPPTGGNVYSYSSSMSFVLDDTVDYGLTSVVLQFQTSGLSMDLASIRLSIQGNTYYLDAPNASYIQEWAGGSASFAGLDNRVAIQWDLSSLGLTGPTTYQIYFDAPMHASFQRALLDTTGNPYQQIVPTASTWIQGGTNLSWTTGNNWLEGSAPAMDRGNVRFNNHSEAVINLGANREVAELNFAGSDVTINGTAGQILTANTGITAAGTGGTYIINSDYRFGATNMINIQAGSVVRINGVISGNFGGLVKEGAGFLDLANHNTFNATVPGGSASVEVHDGILRIGGSNQYSGTTDVLFGRLIIAANAMQGSGALGTSNTNVSLGAGGFFTGSADTVAEIYLEGDVTMGRNISLSENQTRKTLAATGTTNGAQYTGNINLGSTSNVSLFAENANDTVSFSGNISGGSNQYAGGVPNAVTAVNIHGTGTVIFSGNTKSYTGNTTVQSGAHLKLNTTLAGNGSFAMDGGTLSGTGILKKDLIIDAGDIISPGNSVGRFHVGEVSAYQQVTFASGGKYHWEFSSAQGDAGVDWDHLDISGSLSVTATATDPFTLVLSALNVTNFNPLHDYDWVILSASNGINGFDHDAFQFDLSQFTLETLGHFSVLQNNNDLVLRYVHVIPEPSKALLLLTGLITTFLRRRRENRIL